MAPSPAADAAFMQHALTLAACARGRTAPNPMVGAVVVAGGQVVGAGFHARAGEPHAEPEALAVAGARARGATLYVTLEPCHHTGRTGPCTEAILRAGIARVVVGDADTDPRTLGRGLVFLRAHGVQVSTHVLAAPCARLNTAYHFAKATRRSLLCALWPLAPAGAPAARFARAWRRWRGELAQAVDGVVWPVPARGPLGPPALAACRGPDGRLPALLAIDGAGRLRPDHPLWARRRALGARSWRLGGALRSAADERGWSRAGVDWLPGPVPERATGALNFDALLRLSCELGLHLVALEGQPAARAEAAAQGAVQRALCLAASAAAAGDALVALEPAFLRPDWQAARGAFVARGAWAREQAALRR